MKSFYTAALLFCLAFASCSNNATNSNQGASNAPGGENTSKPVVETAKTDYTKLLTVEDVSGVSGMKNLTLVERNVEQRRMGDLNFIQGEKQDVLMVMIHRANQSDHDRIRKQFEKYGYVEFEGLGDMAFYSNKKVMNISINQVTFIKGSSNVTLTSSLDPANMKSFFSREDLIKLAHIMISRM